MHINCLSKCQNELKCRIPIWAFPLLKPETMENGGHTKYPTAKPRKPSGEVKWQRVKMGEEESVTSELHKQQLQDLEEDEGQ